MAGSAVESFLPLSLMFRNNKNLLLFNTLSVFDGINPAAYI